MVHKPFLIGLSVALVYLYKQVSDGECLLTHTDFMGFFGLSSDQKGKRPYSAPCLCDFCCNRIYSGEQIYNFVESLTPFLGVFCSDLFLPAHITYSYTLQNRA